MVIGSTRPQHRRDGIPFLLRQKNLLIIVPVVAEGLNAVIAENTPEPLRMLGRYIEQVEIQPIFQVDDRQSAAHFLRGFGLSDKCFECGSL